ncbi:MAG: tRNA preQ1(34) S-adenosylmethionine ribosyltransferase-isomerase QueA [Chloroflexota bacterium]
MDISLFDYQLPAELIAQTPLAERDASRLMVLDRENGRISHKTFNQIIDYFEPGDILVGNDSRVIPARLYGQKATGGKVELLLLKQIGEQAWQAMVGGKRIKEGTEIQLFDQLGQPSEVRATIATVLHGAQREITFNQATDAWLNQLGHTPLPPYIHETLSDSERYQTVYGRYEGSAAAPTAGLHFSGELLLALRDKGVHFETVTLHVGLDTFKPVAVDQIEAHQIHSEWATVSPETAKRINEAKLAGGRLVAVGTTSVRTLETAALRSAGIQSTLQTISQRDASNEADDFCPWKPVAAFSGPTDLYIHPGYRYRAVDRLITNFHLPKSSLLMLVSAFAGREKMFEAYETAVAEKYRFFSFGDAMFIL